MKEYKRIVESFEEFVSGKPTKIYEIDTTEDGSRRFVFNRLIYERNPVIDVILRPNGQFEVWGDTRDGRVGNVGWYPTEEEFIIVTE